MKSRPHSAPKRTFDHNAQNKVVQHINGLTCVFVRRFLRARVFDPEGAYKQFSETEEWRKENCLEEYYDVIDVEEFETTRVLVSISVRIYHYDSLLTCCSILNGLEDGTKEACL
jgi:hypothetical protein